METETTAAQGAADTEPARHGVPTFAIEAAVALGVLAMGLVILWGSRQLGSGWTSDGPGPGYFPFYIGLILCVSGAGVLWQALFGKNRNMAIFVDGQQVRRVLVVLVPAMLYVAAIHLVGVYVASAVYIAGFMVKLGHYPPLRSGVAAVVVASILFVMFEVWFKVPLAKGALDPLSFLGY